MKYYVKKYNSGNIYCFTKPQKNRYTVERHLLIKYKDVLASIGDEFYDDSNDMVAVNSIKEAHEFAALIALE